MSQLLTKCHNFSQSGNTSHKVVQLLYSKCHNMSQSATTCHNFSQSPTNCHKMSQLLTKCHSVSQSATASHKMSQLLTKYHNSFSYLPTHSRLPSQCLSTPPNLHCGHRAKHPTMHLWLSGWQLSHNSRRRVR